MSKFQKPYSYKSKQHLSTAPPHKMLTMNLLLIYGKKLRDRILRQLLKQIYFLVSGIKFLLLTGFINYDLKEGRYFYSSQISKKEKKNPYFLFFLAVFSFLIFFFIRRDIRVCGRICGKCKKKKSKSKKKTFYNPSCVDNHCQHFGTFGSIFQALSYHLPRFNLGACSQ